MFGVELPVKWNLNVCSMGNVVNDLTVKNVYFKPSKQEMDMINS